VWSAAALCVLAGVLLGLHGGVAMQISGHGPYSQVSVVSAEWLDPNSWLDGALLLGFGFGMVGAVHLLHRADRRARRLRGAGSAVAVAGAIIVAVSTLDALREVDATTSVAISAVFLAMFANPHFWVACALGLIAAMLVPTRHVLTIAR
jgi:hypothetical protein